MSIEETINTAFQKNFYKNHLNISKEDLLNKFVDGKWSEVPVVRKSDIRDNMIDIISYEGFSDVVSSSGTTGSPVHLPVNCEQEKVWVKSVTRVLKELGFSKSDKLINLLSMNDLFTLSPLVWQACKHLESGSFRCSPTRTKLFKDIVTSQSPKYIVGNPMVMLKMAIEMGSDFPSKDILPDYAYYGACAAFDIESDNDKYMSDREKEAFH